MYTKKLKITGHAGAIYDCTFDGHFLYSASADRFVTRWNIADGLQDSFAVKTETTPYAVAVLKEKNYLLIGLSSGAIHVVDLHTKTEIKYFKQHLTGVFALAVNEHLHHVYAADADGNLSVWDSQALRLLLFLPLGCGKIRKITISNDGQHLVLSCMDGTIRVFETTGFNEIVTLAAHQEGATIGVFHPLFPNLLLSGGKDAHLKLWNWKEGKLIKDIPAHNYVIYDLIFLNNGRQFVTASRDKHIKTWDSVSMEVQQRLDLKNGGHQHSVNALCKIDEHRFASASDDKQLIVWDKLTE